MQFDLRKFYDTADQPCRLEFESDFSGMDFPGYSVAVPAKCVFTALPTSAGMDMELSVRAVVLAECARCLSPMEQECSIERTWQFKLSDFTGEDFDLPRSEKGCLELDELVFQEIVLEVPPVLVCSPDCQGLCPICGKKKAAGCSCQQADSAAPVDARLSILKQLLN